MGLLLPKAGCGSPNLSLAGASLQLRRRYHEGAFGPPGQMNPSAEPTGRTAGRKPATSLQGCQPRESFIRSFPAALDNHCQLRCIAGKLRLPHSEENAHRRAIELIEPGTTVDSAEDIKCPTNDLR